MSLSKHLLKSINDWNAPKSSDIDHGLRGPNPMEICRRSQRKKSEYVLTLLPKNVTFFHSKLLLDNSVSFTSSRMKDLRQKWKVKLIFRGAWNSLMAWPAWPTLTRLLYDRSTPLPKRPVCQRSQTRSVKCPCSVMWTKPMHAIQYTDSICQEKHVLVTYGQGQAARAKAFVLQGQGHSCALS